MEEKLLIEIKDLRKVYGSKVALNHVDLKLHAGKIVGLLGPNASGKTTLIKILNGLLHDYSGSVSIDGCPIGAHSKSIVSYLPDTTYLADWMKVKDAVDIFKGFYKDLDYPKLTNMLAMMKINMSDKIRTMSKGTKEKMQLALVMSRKAQIYILDEPIGGVDPAARELILDTILENYQAGALLIVSTHLIHDIERIFDEVVFLRDGEVALHQDVESIRNSDKTVESLFLEVFRGW